MPPYFESHEDIKVTGLAGGGVGAVVQIVFCCLHSMLSLDE